MFGILAARWRTYHPPIMASIENAESYVLLFIYLFIWDSLHARLNSHYVHRVTKKEAQKDYRIQKICLERAYS